MQPDARDNQMEGGHRDEETLRERARRLAQIHTPPSGPEVDVLRFRLHAEQYAVELRSLRAIHHAHGLTSVPCTPPFIAGVLNVRGEVVTVLALDLVLDLVPNGQARQNPPDQARVLLAEYRQMPVGLLVDEVLGMDRFALATLEHGFGGKEYVYGIADACTALLDLEQIFADTRFDVSEDVA